MSVDYTEVIEECNKTHQRIDKELDDLYFNVIKVIAQQHIPKITDEAVIDLIEELGNVTLLQFKCSVLGKYIDLSDKKESIEHIADVLVSHFKVVLGNI